MSLSRGGICEARTGRLMKARQMNPDGVTSLKLSGAKEGLRAETSRGHEPSLSDFAMMYPLLALAPGEIHLWLSFYDEIADERLPAYRELLAAEERRKEQRFYFARD